MGSDLHKSNSREITRSASPERRRSRDAIRDSIEEPKNGESELGRMERENAKLLKELEELKRSSLKMQSNYDISLIENSTLREGINQSHKIQYELSRERDSGKEMLISTISENTTLKWQNEALKGELEILQKEHEFLRRDNSSLRDALGEKIDHLNDVPAKEISNALLAERDRLGAENTRILRENASLQKSNDALQKSNGALQTAFADTLEKYEELKAQTYEPSESSESSELN